MQRRESIRVAQRLFPLLSLALFLPWTSASVRAQATPNGAVDGLTPKFIDAGGVRTRYYEMGQGEPLVLIHGGGGSSPNSANIWSKNIRPLAEHFHVIAPDRLGCGMTGGTFADTSNYTAQVNWLYNFLVAMHLHRVNLVGHSAGGAVVFFFALAHPEMIQTLVIGSHGPEMSVAPGPRELNVLMKACPKQPLLAAQKCRLSLLSYDPQRTFDSQFWAAQRYMANWRSQQASAAHRSIPQVSPLNLPTSRSFARFRDQAWTRARQGALGDMPVLMIYGKQDPLDWQAGQPAAQLTGGLSFFGIVGAKDPNLQMVILNDAGHFAFRDQPAEFDADLTSFIDYWDHRASR